jgi:hypothetical protein
MGTEYRKSFLLNALLVVILSFCFRVLYLDFIPGINADELWNLYTIRQNLSGTDVSTWFVPSGRLISLPYCLQVWFIDKIFPSSFWTIRLIAALSGILSVVVCFVLFRKAFGSFVAACTTLLIAVMPINITFSRIGWEYSQISLFVVLILGFAFNENWFLLAVTYVLALLLHPTFLYLSPVLFLPTILYKDKLQHLSKRLKVFIYSSLAATLLILTSSVFILVKDIQGTIFAKLGALPDNLLDIRKSLYFLTLLSDLFSVRISTRILGLNVPIEKYLEITVLLLFCCFLLTFFVRVFRKNEAVSVKDISFIVGYLFIVYVFYLTNGIDATLMPYERHSLFLVVPSITAFSICLKNALSNRKHQQIALWGISLVCWLYLSFFYKEYIQFFKETGGQGCHPTYNTGAVELKKEAFDWIRNDYSIAKSKSPGNDKRELVIVVNEWRLYSPLKYLAETADKITVADMKEIDDPVKPTRFSNRYSVYFSEREPYFLGTDSAGLDNWLKENLPTLAFKQKDFANTAGEKILTVWYQSR